MIQNAANDPQAMWRIINYRSEKKSLKNSNTERQSYILQITIFIVKHINFIILLLLLYIKSLFIKLNMFLLHNFNFT